MRSTVCPAAPNRETETQILKRAWGFDGFVESDYTAVAELRACPPKTPDSGPCGHGVAADGPDAGALALNAGTDSEMVSTNIRDYGRQLLAQHRISIARIDDAVRRILRVKLRAGLFEHPYVDVARAKDPASFVTSADRAAARDAAARSMVLLKNDGATLPLDPGKSTVVIGPLGDDQHDMLGPWWGRGQDADAVSVLDGLKAQDARTTFVQGCTAADTEPPNNKPDDVCGSDAGFAEAVQAARDADQVVLALGETRLMSGEAASRSNIKLPGRQQELIDAIKATGKPFVVVLFNGRPLDLTDVAASAPAILEAWFPGVEAGNAVADVLLGKVDPGGKLPVSFPQSVGQVPVNYNHEPTGRPCDVSQKYNSRYRDLPTCAPLYAFGYGLSYTTFRVSNLQLSSPSVARWGRVTATVDVRNTGRAPGRRGRAALPPRSCGEHLATGAASARVPTGDARPRPVADVELHARPQRLRLLRQPRALRRRAGTDRRVRRRQLGGRRDRVLHGDGMRLRARRRTTTRLWRPMTFA